MIHPIQVLEALEAGARAILLIVRALEDEEAMRRQGKHRPRTISVWSYSLIPRLIQETPMIATVTSRIAKRMAERWPLRIHPFPFEQDPVRVYGYWHASRDRDPILQRFVEILHENTHATDPAPTGKQAKD